MMSQIVKSKGVRATVQNTKFKAFLTAAIAVSVVLIGACGGPAGQSNGSTGPVDPNESAATVNGRVIKMEDVERAVKQQAQGQESKLSDIERAAARLQVLQTLIEQEVMFQKAEKEGTVPSDDEVTAELNKQKTQSGKSADQIDKEMKESGVTDASVRDSIKKGLAIQKLTDKVTGKIEPPKDAEIDAFYNGNKDAFVKKRGVKLAAIVIDPSNSGEGDATTDEQSAVIRGNEIIKKLQQGQNFASLAREFSEDQSKFQDGDLGYISEEQMKQTFPAQLVANLMNPAFEVGKVVAAPMQGKFYILKLQERSDKDEAVTLESPGIRQQVTDSLINSRKQLLTASYQAIAMNEAKIENHLARKVVDNPNELSGARPAPAATIANANTAATSNTNAATANANNAPAATFGSTPNANTAKKPAANANAPANVNKAK
jgi:parvulin-like peptidyl-prolyl isomerase